MIEDFKNIESSVYFTALVLIRMNNDWTDWKWLNWLKWNEWIMIELIEMKWMNWNVLNGLNEMKWYAMAAYVAEVNLLDS